MDVLGDQTLLRSISRSDCRELLDLFSRLPCNARKRWPEKGVWRSGRRWRDRGPASYERREREWPYEQVLRAAELGRSGRPAPRNPALGLRLPDPVGRRDKRRPFSIEQLRSIFRSPLYTGCQDDHAGYASIGPNRPQRARFWVPVIALFTGMRLNEICQMDAADVRDFDGVLCFVVTANSLTGNLDKRLRRRPAASGLCQSIRHWSISGSPTTSRLAGARETRSYSPSFFSGTVSTATNSAVGLAVSSATSVQPLSAPAFTRSVITSATRAERPASTERSRSRWADGLAPQVQALPLPTTTATGLSLGSFAKRCAAFATPILI